MGDKGQAARPGGTVGVKYYRVGVMCCEVYTVADCSRYEAC